LGKFLGSYRYEHVRLLRDRAVPELFAKPGGAAVDESFKE